jgi:vancomycin resistance protein VanW
MKDLPREARRWACQVRRTAADLVTGRRWRMVAPHATALPEDDSLTPQLSLEQRILPTEHWEAKVHNIRCAAARVQNLAVLPGTILSFWRVVGRPTPANGYQRGRSLLGGQLQLDYGGGLCQLSGLLYQLSLQAGLTILERHPHSLDIYHDAERYAPLGADATVAYAFKDFRIQNNTAAAFCFRISVTSEKMTAQLCAPLAIKPNVIEFVRTPESSGACTVATRRWQPDGKNYEVVAVSHYRVGVPSN